jgi:plastocyanin
MPVSHRGLDARLPGARARAAALLAVAALFALGVGRVAADQAATISDAGYEPQVITIHAGESISWINNGATGQSVTADDGTFDSGPIDHGRTYAVTLTELGTFNVHSTLGGFRGRIVVLGIDVTTPPLATARPSIMDSGPLGATPADPGPLAIGAIAAAIVILGLAAYGASLRARRSGNPGPRNR